MEGEKFKNQDQSQEASYNRSNLNVNYNQEHIQVQPGDAQEHMLRAMSQENSPFQFDQMQQALQQQQYQQYQQQNQYVPQYEGQVMQFNNQNYFFHPYFQQWILIPEQPQQQMTYREQEGRGRGRGCGRGRGRGRGRGMGRGRNNHQYDRNSQGQSNCLYQNSPYKQEEQYSQHVKQQGTKVDQGQQLLEKKQRCNFPNQRKCQKMFKRCSPSSSSESDQDQEQNPRKKQYKNEIVEYYTSEMKDFLNKRKVNPGQQQKIVNFLKNNFPQYNAPIRQIKQAIMYFQTHGLLFNVSYQRAIRVFLNHGRDYGNTMEKLKKIQERKSKKIEADRTFKDENNGLELEPMLLPEDLLQLNLSKTIFLVDGNNIMPTSKHFRHYFQSYNRQEKIEAQIRLRWFISIAFEPDSCILFFDQKYGQEEVAAIEAVIVPTQEQKERISRIKVIYGQTEKADEKIVRKCEELKNNEQYERQAILVSSDRQLFVRSKAVLKQMDHTGGRFFFRFLGKTARFRCRGDKQKKKLLRSILTGRQD